MSGVSHSSFVSPEFIIRAATENWEFQGVARLRHAVFVDEQRIFKLHDRDEVDDVAIPLAAITTMAAEPAEVVGTVRIHQPSPGTWWGSRLAVDCNYRRVGKLGAELIRLAVCSANGMGCVQFNAHVQHQNVPLFRRLHWDCIAPVDLHGVPHMHMRAALDHYPAILSPETGWCARSRRAG